MPTVPKKVAQRLINKTPFYQKILEQAKDKDRNEADTVTIVVDMLKDVFGFDKYSEIEKEFPISGTFCDLAIKIGNKIEYLLEVKAIGMTIKETHVRQAINYCARQEDVKWVVLTNGIDWMVYRVALKGKVTHEQVCKFNFLDVNPRRQAHQDMLFMLCRKGMDKDLLDQHYDRQQLLNKFTIAATLMSEEMHKAIKSLLRKISPNLKIDEGEIKDVIENDVIKRELVESDMSKDAMKKIKRARTAKKKRAVKKTVTKPDESSGSTINTGTE